MFAQLLDSALRRLQQPDAGTGYLAQVMGRDIGGHANGDAGGTVEQHMRHPCRQHRRLIQGTVEIGHPVDRPQRGLGKQ